MGVWVAAAVALFVCLVGSEARAEEDVRISVVSGVKSLQVAGTRLEIFDGKTGTRLVSWPNRRPLKVKLEGAELTIVDPPSRVLARARKIVVEARDGVQLDQGVYLGRMEVVPQKAGLLAINRLPVETYLLGIVGSEMNPSWPMEALKAQAVAARTYAMQRRMLMRAANRAYDLESSVLSQVYKGAERIRPSVIRAVRETHGEVLAYRHDLVEALFHSTCGGHTVSAGSVFGRDVAYLQPRACRWCRGSSMYRWDKTIPMKSMSQRLEKARLAGPRVRNVERSDERRPVLVEDATRRVYLQGTRMRSAVGYDVLYSHRFTAKTRADRVVLQGQGFGHGVGMCQWGARGMALEGRKHQEILAHYYAGARVIRIY